MKTHLCLGILTAFLLTGCVQYASGYKKKGGGSADAGPQSEACLKLALKKAQLKLQDEEEEETGDEEVTEDEEVSEDEEFVEDGSGEAEACSAPEETGDEETDESGDEEVDESGDEESDESADEEFVEEEV